MIPKAFASAACIGFCALITFGSSLTPDRNSIATGRGAALEALQPTLEQGHDSRSSASNNDAAPFGASGPGACSDSIANCSDPVKHLGTQNDCACFACGYGTASQRTVCTRNAADKDALFKRAK
jgi:hypothetical protein